VGANPAEGYLKREGEKVGHRSRLEGGAWQGGRNQVEANPVEGYLVREEEQVGPPSRSEGGAWKQVGEHRLEGSLEEGLLRGEGNSPSRQRWVQGVEVLDFEILGRVEGSLAREGGREGREKAEPANSKRQVSDKVPKCRDSGCSLLKVTKGEH
jgi:hypothetical protein